MTASVLCAALAVERELRQVHAELAALEIRTTLRQQDTERAVAKYNRGEQPTAGEWGLCFGYWRQLHTTLPIGRLKVRA